MRLRNLQNDHRLAISDDEWKHLTPLQFEDYKAASNLNLSDDEWERLRQVRAHEVDVHGIGRMHNKSHVRRPLERSAKKAKEIIKAAIRAEKEQKDIGTKCHLCDLEFSNHIALRWHWRVNHGIAREATESPVSAAGR